MDVYVTEALKDAELERHTETVIAVLSKGCWCLNMLSNPDYEQSLVTMLKGPWLYYKEKGEMPRKLDHLSVDAIGDVHNAAVVIASSLISKKPSLEVFLQTIPRAFSDTRSIESISRKLHAKPFCPESVLPWTSFVDEVKNHVMHNESKVSFPNLPMSIRAICERDVQMHFQMQVTEQFNSVFKQTGMKLGFVSHEAADNLVGEPDIVLVNENWEVQSFVEIKTKWALDDLISNSLTCDWKNDTSLRNSIFQVMGYLCHNRLKYGCLTSFERTWFLKRENMDLFISEPILYNSTAPTLYQALNFLIAPDHLGNIKAYSPPSISDSEYSAEDSMPSEEDNSEQHKPGKKRKRDAENLESADRRHGRKRKATIGSCLPAGFSMSLFQECVGRGACGPVYKCHFKGVDLAVKMCDVFNNKDGVKDMKQEIRIYQHLKDLQGISIPELKFYGEAWGFFFIATTFIDGSHPDIDSESIQEMLSMRLKELKDFNVVHGDVKSKNMILTPTGNLVLIDFSHSYTKK